MRRKQTELEYNLYEIGYRLDHKTYCGKKSEKVDQFVYTKHNGFDVMYVYLNRERTKIESFGFTSNRYRQYNVYSIDNIQIVYETLENSLKEIYDFENQVAKHYQKIELADIENTCDIKVNVEEPFIEESAFDD